MTHVVVAGAGYAGVVAAKRLLTKNPSLQVTVVNPRTEFVERIRLHQVAAGTHSGTVPLTSALHRRARLVVDTVATIDAPHNTVRLAGGDALAYDHLIYAVGSASRIDDLPGAREHACAVGEYDSARASATRLTALPAGAPVVVVGGGPTAIETAAELAEQLPALSIVLVSGSTVAEDLPDKARGQIRRTLAALGVTIDENSPVARVREHSIELADGRQRSAECVIIAVASAVPDLARSSGLPTDPDGRLLVDDTLICPSFPNIVGAGDAAVIDGMPLRMSCQAAIPLGAHAADTVLRSLGGKTPAPVRPRFVGRNLSLGRRSALVQFTDAEDNPRTAVLGGRFGAWWKERVCAASLDWGVNPRRPFLYTWS
ncbi:MAG: FAD-dependent oxidoreductase [Rhodococcus sp. (in: high G+C Gram-positive bacteria)]|uniref:NAD(P)/FAD-dependent oxidoreductase n=1 Tax=Rhodococcus sp. TaxID=1831 RepID=UPI003BB6AB2B